MHRGMKGEDDNPHIMPCQQPAMNHDGFRWAP